MFQRRKIIIAISLQTEKVSVHESTFYLTLNSHFFFAEDKGVGGGGVEAVLWFTLLQLHVPLVQSELRMYHNSYFPKKLC